MNYDMDDFGSSGNARRGNTGRTCYVCGNLGHLAKNCQANNPQNNQNQNRGGNNRVNKCRGPANPLQPQRGPKQATKQCDNCPHLSNHSTAECKKKNGAQNTNGTNETASKTRSGSRMISELEMSQDLTPYCPTCNSTSHRSSTCPASREHHTIKCEKCGAWGHTRDDCQNPIKRRCSNCYAAGSATNQCRCRSEGISWAHLYFSRGRRAQPGFKWKLPTWDPALGLPPPNTQNPKAVRSPIDTQMQTIVENASQTTFTGPMTRQRLRSITTNAAKVFQGGGLPTEI